MKSLLVKVSVTLVILSASHGATTFDFESANAGVTGGTPLPTQVTVQNAYWETEDEFGYPLVVPGFRADVSSTVLLGDPFLAGYGSTISGNALDGTNGPVMFTFGRALNVSTFGVTLDNSTLGNIPQVGGNPAFGTNVLFYDAVDNLIGFIPLDETVSGFTVSNAPVSFLNVSKVILPSGAFYDRLSFNAEAGFETIPEPTMALLSGLGTLALLKRRRA